MRAGGEAVGAGAEYRDQVPDWLEVRDGFDPLSADFPTFDGASDDDGGQLGPDGDGVLDGLEGWLARNGALVPVTTASADTRS